MAGARGVGLPSGLVAFLFSDIEGSTRLARTQPDAYPAVIDAHDDCLRGVWAHHRGVEISTEGDSFFVVFESASDALRAAVDAQDRLRRVDWPVPDPVRVRIGIHAGFVRPHRGNYSALPVNQAARVSAAANGGQTLASAHAIAAAATTHGVDLSSLGRFRVRDFTEALELFEVFAPGGAPSGLAPRVHPDEHHNLLRPPDHLVGRDDDLAAVDELFDHSRLVSIVGSGGVGKTRIAVEFGLRTRRFDDGVWFVDLAALATVDRVADAVADAVGIDSAPGVDVETDLLVQLADARLLVILDNCEHLDRAALGSFVTTLLSSCTHVAVLATSRTSLGLRTEIVHRLAPLAADTDEDPAVELYAERAGVFEPSETADVLALCQRLDGLPLAIELAASRAATLGPAHVIETLADDTIELHSDDPTLPDRHRTMDAVLQWSVDLLHPDAARLLGELSVLTAGFEPGLVVQAFGAPAEEFLAQLVDGSLVVRDSGRGTPRRFRLPATVRTWLQRHPDAVDGADAVDRLAAVYDDHLGPDAADSWMWMGEMAAEIDNIRGLLDELAGRDPVTAQRLAWSIGRFHDKSATYAAGVAELSSLCGRLEGESPAYVGLLAQHADLLLRVGRLDEAAAAIDAAAELRARVGGPSWDDAGLDATRGGLALEHGHAERAEGIAGDALQRAVSHRSRARLLAVRGIARAITGRTAEAAEAFEQELAHIEAGQFDTFLPVTLGNLAEAWLRAGEPSKAARHQMQALELARTRNDRVTAALSLIVAARLAADLDRHADALVLVHAADRALADIGFRLYVDDAERLASIRAEACDVLAAAEVTAAAERASELGFDGAADLAGEVLQDATKPRPTIDLGERR